MGAAAVEAVASPWGKAFTALRDNPIRAESLGVDIQAYTLLSFAIGAVYAGVAGALFASLVRVHRACAVLGRRVDHDVPDGRRRRRRAIFFGPLLGAGVGVLVPEWLRDVPYARDWYLPLFGVAVVMLMLWLPDGLL